MQNGSEGKLPHSKYGDNLVWNSQNINRQDLILLKNWLKVVGFILIIYYWKLLRNYSSYLIKQKKIVEYQVLSGQKKSHLAMLILVTNRECIANTSNRFYWWFPVFFKELSCDHVVIIAYSVTYTLMIKQTDFPICEANFWKILCW